MIELTLESGILLLFKTGLASCGITLMVHATPKLLEQKSLSINWEHLFGTILFGVAVFVI